MFIRNPFANALFLPSLQVVGGLFLFAIAVVLFFARHDLRAGIRGELGKRLIGWMILTPLFLIYVFVDGLVGAALLLLFLFRVAFEYVRVVGVQRSYALYLYALILLTFAVAEFLPSFYFILPAGSILLLTLVPMLSGELQDLYAQLSFAGRGYLYLVWSMGHLILIRDLAGPEMVLLVGIAVALSDGMQFVVGKLIGRHVISPAVNPRKAWEGLLGDFVGAGAGVALMRFVLPTAFLTTDILALAFLIGLGAAWGDLASSLVKRVAGVKDWGDLIPGHGGMMDRANSLVVVVPLVYYFLYLVLNVRSGS